MKRAFLAGINAYGQAPLRGCVNDVQAVYALLTQLFGFQPDDVRVLVDGRATTDAMKERLDWLTTGVKPGDTVVFHYSGHGSQVRDRGPQDELADHMDEILCPVDLDWQSKVITDDDLAAYLQRIPRGANCYVILDCCHSGTGTRELRPPGEDNPGHDIRSRYLPPPFDLEARFLGRQLPRHRIGKGNGTNGASRVVGVPAEPPRGFWGWLRRVFKAKPAPPPPPPKVDPFAEMNHVLISGCRSDQTSADAYIEGRYTGALTYHLVKSVRQSGTVATLASVVAFAQSCVRSAKFTQEPQLEGPKDLLDKPIFS
jgi:hypothetical protein